ncbi:MAG: MazG-like family protein [Planctomycetota bacterium]|nr:MazG-like family protein [Planctomycetota bacterium]
MADVLCYAMAMANELGLDISQTVRAKMARNVKKYPVDKIKGRYGHDDPSPSAEQSD